MGELWWIGFGLGLLILYVGDRTVRQLSPRTRPFKLIDRGSDESFGIWLDIERASLVEFSAGHVDEWECGATFELSGPGEINPDCTAKRGSIKIYSSLNALSETNQIGHGKLHEQYAQLYVGLKPEQVAVLLNEVRQGPGSAHAHGYINDKGQVRLTYFSFKPSDLG